MSQKLKVAVVGLGVGMGHLEAYAKITECYEVVAVCDLNAERCAQASQKYAVAHIFSSLADLLSSGVAEVIDLCTPPNTHCEMIEQVLRNGLHVICEKPLVGSLAQMDQVMQAQAASKGQLFPIFQYRFGHGLQQLKHLQTKGFAHTPYLSTIETTWRRGADYYAVPWRGKWASERGGCCLTHASHAHDLLTLVNGPIKTVFAHLATRVNPIEVEDCAAISVGMANGSVATLSITLGAAENASRLRFDFSDLTAISGSPEPYRPGKGPWHFKGHTPETDAAIAQALQDFVPGLESFEGQFALIHDAIVNAAPNPVSLADARQALELITAIYYSGETGQAVQLPISQAHPKYADWAPASGKFSSLF